MLAGGASRRMGCDKAALAVDGASLGGRAVERLREVCAEVCLADAGRGLLLPGCPSVADGPGAGPAAGILGAARVFPGRPLLVFACDLPRVPPALLAELAGLAAPAVPAAGEARCDWAVPRWRRGVEPLCALYGPRALAALARLVAAGVAAPHRLTEVESLAVLYLDGKRLRRFGRPEELFLNLNTPRDLARWRAAERMAQV